MPNNKKKVGPTGIPVHFSMKETNDLCPMVDQLRNSEANARRIANVEACFGTNGKQLKLDQRVLVGEGVLVKICRKKPKSRQFFLFNDILVYGSIIIPNRKYSNQHIIPLEDVMLENLEDDRDMQNGWLIKTRTKSFVVFAATPSEKREWVMHIHRCIQILLTNGKTPARNHAAVWVPDSVANKCMCCLTSHFSVVNRRHHCRACGIVCNGCSSNSFIINGLSNKPVRVCDTCYNRLCQGICANRPTNFSTQATSHNAYDDDKEHFDATDSEDDNQQNCCNDLAAAQPV